MSGEGLRMTALPSVCQKRQRRSHMKSAYDPPNKRTYIFAQSSANRRPIVTDGVVISYARQVIANVCNGEVFH